MSDDDDEFGGLAPTTPAIRVKKSATSRATKPNSRSQAGPSSKPKGGRKNVPIPLSDHSEVEEIDPFDFPKQDDDDDDEHPAAPVAARAARTEASAVNAVNGKWTGKGKGKAKSAQPKSSQTRTAPESMDVDPIEILHEQNEEQDAAAEVASAINTAGRHKRTNPTATRPGMGDQVLAEQLRRAEEQVKTLSMQLEELLQVRETEPEQLLKQQEIQYESQLQAQQALIQELHSLLGMKEPLIGPAHANVLNLLTREAADEEMRALQKEVSRWRDVANEKQRVIEQRDEKIALLEQSQKELRFELDNEIKRSAALNAKINRNPPSVRGGGRPGGVEDPRHAEVLRFYEDLSNLLVPNMKAQPGKYLDLEDWVLSCIYTFNDDEAPDQVNAPKKSLNFTLRCCYESPGDLDPEMVTSKDQLVPTVHFTPLELDKESPEFVASLDFLGSAFSFGRNQLPLFLRTIYQRMKEAVLDEAENDDESVEIIEET